jgi:hypothetical protein
MLWTLVVRCFRQGPIVHKGSAHKRPQVLKGRVQANVIFTSYLQGGVALSTSRSNYKAQKHGTPAAAYLS